MNAEGTKALILDAQRGDREAFARLVDRYQNLALGYAYGWLGDSDRANDVAQEAFIDAFLHLHQLREPAAFAGWLRRIVHKHCDRQTRRRTVEPELQENQVQGPDAAAQRAQEARWVRRAIEALPQHERLVVALHYLGECPQKEVAELLELPLSTIKKRLHSARQRLRERSEDMTEKTFDDMRAHLQLADRIRLFLEVRAGDKDAVQAILSRQSALLEAEESWSFEEAMEGGIPLAHRQTPLILAAGRGDLQMVNLLLSLGAHPDGSCGCKNRETALWAAAANGRAEVAKALLSAGADPNAANAVGHAPLHVAAMRGHADVVRALLEHGAKPQLTACSGMTALDWARLRTHTEVADLLGGGPIAPPSTEELRTGIKALDLWAPLSKGSLVQVHAAAETGLMVLLAELSRRFAASPVESGAPGGGRGGGVGGGSQVLAGGGVGGGTCVWAGWELEPWQEGTLEGFVAEAGIADCVNVVTAGPADALVDRALATVERLSQEHDQVVLFLFQEEGRAGLVEAALPRLTERASIAFVIQPWLPVTQGALAPAKALAPYHARICTDPQLAKAGLYPAIDPIRSASKAPQSAQGEALRARAMTLLASEDEAVADRKRLLQDFLSQPFVTFEHQTGYAGVSVTESELLFGVERILSGALDTLPEGVLRYRGALPQEPIEEAPRAVVE